MLYSGMRLPASRRYDMGQVNRVGADASTLQRDALELAQEIAKRDPAPSRRAKRASNITMDIVGRRYVLSRMEELLDPAPALTLQLPHDSEAS
jgi:enoyl-CoA hydratase/carnithine racemase